MTDVAGETLPQNPAPFEAEGTEASLPGPGVMVGLLWMIIAGAVWKALEKAERNHHRAELLAAYRRRKSWKKSDIPHLKSLGVNKVALRRMEALEGTGRPVVRPHQPLDEIVVKKLDAFLTLLGDGTPPDKRKQAFRLWPWWPHYVEALYRGEHALAKEQGIAGPSDYAERSVGSEFGISAAKVHSICGEIRRKRKEWDGAADFPAMTLSEYRGWMEAENFGVARLG
jgi:hypothetical protein